LLLKNSFRRKKNHRGESQEIAGKNKGIVKPSRDARDRWYQRTTIFKNTGGDPRSTTAM
jgi:hypothetical protein